MTNWRRNSSKCIITPLKYINISIILPVTAELAMYVYVWYLTARNPSLCYRRPSNHSLFKIQYSNIQETTSISPYKNIVEFI